MGILVCATLLVMFGKFRFSCFIVGVLIWALAGAAQAQSRLADRDGDGLIEVDSLTKLHNMRHNLAGTSYKSSATSVGNTLGCPRRGCNGYELTRDLDFDADGDGSSWTANSDGSYMLDDGDNRAPYFEVDSDGAGGWQPIGDSVNHFVAVFDGNGYSIRNLGIRRAQAYIALFAVIGEGAAIRHVGLVDNLADSTATGDALVGGLVGSMAAGSIVASHATGPAVGVDGSQDRVGGLVGSMSAGSIVASYASGPVDGRDGIQDEVGGLVGRLEGGSITASYATGPAAGGSGNDGHVGGLVGLMDAGSITASYATGPADGGSGDADHVGGLVGTLNQDQGSIVASYATGPATGAGISSGSLVGFLQGGLVITASYGFGANEDPDNLVIGTPPSRVSVAADLTAANAGPAWNAVANGTFGAWDFGTASQPPALRYADYDGAGPAFDCNQFPAGACGSLVPGQDELVRSGPFPTKLAAVLGAEVTLSFSLRFDRAPISSWSWRQLSGPTVPLTATDSPVTGFTAPAQRASLVFELTATTSRRDEYTGLVSLEIAAADQIADFDGDGLIDIDSLLRLNSMRENLAGTGYAVGVFDSIGTPLGFVATTIGCPATGCFGYELTRDLDFDLDGDGSTWTGDSVSGYRLDQGDENRFFTIFDDGSGSGGWRPVGADGKPFVAVFDGNGYSIRNLATIRDEADIGLFAAIGEGAAIRNIGLVNNLAASIFAGSTKNVGGLVGEMTGGSITASYATGPADGGSVGGGTRYVGGLVGQMGGGSITASYATGPVEGKGAGNDAAGGLVGRQFGGSITASYATGPVVNETFTGSGGGLVGDANTGSGTASYASGPVRGNFNVGPLWVDVSRNNQLTASYGFGPVTNTSGGIVSPDGTPPSGVSVAADLTLALAGSSWNADSSNTMGAWDFGTPSQPPVLRYGDYDGAGTVFDCSQAPTGACGAPLPGQGVLGAQVPSTALSGAQVSLAGAIDARVTISSWRWRQLQGPTVTLTAADSPVASFRTPAQDATLVFELIATTEGGFEYRELFRLTVFEEGVDNDIDGLIEIHDLTMLHNMRHNLAGTSYKSSEDAVGNTFGCPATGCIGYELVGDLDFDLDGDGSSWTGDSSESYRLDADDSHAPYFVVDRRGNGGWQPVGSESNPFVAVFDGNGYAIRNLGIRRAQENIGLFGFIAGNAAIRNLGLVANLADSTFDSGSSVGGLVGRQDDGSITASYATGTADGGSGDDDRVGGLVGLQRGGSITASYATGPVAAKGTNFDAAGGLVGWQNGASITASYATGPVVSETENGGGGGLLGYPNFGASITASYASGSVTRKRERRPSVRL